ncbi:MAG TPA: hypothetical protein VGG57_16000 [Stellaceae bacterium]|jgi:hypothetical protein
MPVDVRTWRKALFDVAGCLADEALQRRSWLGTGPEEWSPTALIDEPRWKIREAAERFRALLLETENMAA